MTDSWLFITLLALVIAGFLILVWPRRGLLARRAATHARARREDALKHIHRCERHGRQATPDSLGTALGLTEAQAGALLAELGGHGLLVAAPGGARLTEAGRREAVRVLRAHRLWERHLADRTGYDNREWHEHADAAEHRLSPEEVDALALALGNPSHDPHGDPIPTPTGELGGHGGVPLARLPAGSTARIVHLEDEPEAVYARLTALGLFPGQRLLVAERTPHETAVRFDGAECRLTPAEVANVSVAPPSGPEDVPPEAGDYLSDLAPGESAEVLGLTEACRGSERRRFLDLGLLPGTRVTAELRSPSGDPTAYRIRDTLLALRREQAGRVRVRREGACAGNTERPPVSRPSNPPAGEERRP